MDLVVHGETLDREVWHVPTLPSAVIALPDGTCGSLAHHTRDTSRHACSDLGARRVIAWFPADRYRSIIWPLTRVDPEARVWIGWPLGVFDEAESFHVLGGVDIGKDRGTRRPGPFIHKHGAATVGDCAQR